MVVFGRDRIKVCFEDRLTKWRGGGYYQNDLGGLYLCWFLFWNTGLGCIFALFDENFRIGIVLT